MYAIRAAPRVAPSAGLQGHGGGADAAARTPAAAPTPAAAALAVAGQACDMPIYTTGLRQAYDRPTTGLRQL